MQGLATQNARSPMVVRRALGMSSLAEDRSLLRDSMAATCCSWSATNWNGNELHIWKLDISN